MSCWTFNFSFFPVSHFSCRAVAMMVYGDRPGHSGTIKWDEVTQRRHHRSRLAPWRANPDQTEWHQAAPSRSASPILERGSVPG